MNRSSALEKKETRPSCASALRLRGVAGMLGILYRASRPAVRRFVAREGSLTYEEPPHLVPEGHPDFVPTKCDSMGKGRSCRSFGDGYDIANCDIISLSHWCLRK